MDHFNGLDKAWPDFSGSRFAAQLLAMPAIRCLYSHRPRGLLDLNGRDDRWTSFSDPSLNRAGFPAKRLGTHGQVLRLAASRPLLCPAAPWGDLNRRFRLVAGVMFNARSGNAGTTPVDLLVSTR